MASISINLIVDQPQRQRDHDSTLVLIDKIIKLARFQPSKFNNN